MDIATLKTGIIGGGAMAENILRGVLEAGTLSPAQITVSDIHGDRLKYISKTFSVSTVRDNVELVSGSDLLILAVKPQNMRMLLEEIKKTSTDSKLYLSIAAGVTAASIAQGLDNKGRIIRIMPNLAARVLKSASAVSMGPGATQDDLGIAKTVFEAIGQTVVINEDLMDAVTGLSGSGPAYFFLIIEALADAGVKSGLTRPVAQSLAAQTALGAAQLVLESGGSPATLKDQVTSPGGTTISGMHVLEKGGVRGALMDAVLAAVERSKELGKQ
ncbi:MAG: pyrroline-5-carboxylate reductase [Deltaproteobacteria bacterium]|nr:pyrroline-5-carboxylate reductase [Deltaproteobacteria bacterium]